VRPRSGIGAASAESGLLVARDVARVVLVDVELPVEAEEVGIGAEEALDVGLRGKHVEALLLEPTEVLAPDLGRELRLGELDPLPQTRVLQTRTDLEHAPILEGSCSAGGDRPDRHS
jgi:hypothetical protein